MTAHRSRSRIHPRRAFAALALAAVLSGCSEHPFYPESSSVQLELTPETSLLVALGGRMPLDLKARDERGRLVRPTLLVWSSSDPQTVHVDEIGRITGLRDGLATITVHAGDNSATAQVRVDATVMQSAWIEAVANAELDPTNDRDSTTVVVRANAITFTDRDSRTRR